MRYRVKDPNNGSVANQPVRRLRACRCRARRGASEKRNKISPPHSITSSATDVQVPALKHNPIMPGAGRGVRRFTNRDGWASASRPRYMPVPMRCALCCAANESADGTNLTLCVTVLFAAGNQGSLGRF